MKIIDLERKRVELLLELGLAEACGDLAAVAWIVEEYDALVAQMLQLEMGAA